jgi:hypothetical protein
VSGDWLPILCAYQSHGSTEPHCGECAYCLANAETARLRADLAWDTVEVVRLRTAGDALVEALQAMTRLGAPPDMDELVTWQLGVADPALTTWQEARREQ